MFFVARAASIMFDYFAFFPRFVSRLLRSDCLSNGAGYRLQTLISDMTRSWWELASRLRPWPPVDSKTDGCVCVCVFAAEDSEESGCTAIVDYESWQHARGLLWRL